MLSLSQVLIFAVLVGVQGKGTEQSDHDNSYTVPSTYMNVTNHEIGWKSHTSSQLSTEK